MTEEEKDKLKAILIDLAAEIATIAHSSSDDTWFKEISESIREL